MDSLLDPPSDLDAAETETYKSDMLQQMVKQKASIISSIMLERKRKCVHEALDSHPGPHKRLKMSPDTSSKTPPVSKRYQPSPRQLTPPSSDNALSPDDSPSPSRAHHYIPERRQAPSYTDPKWTMGDHKFYNGNGFWSTLESKVIPFETGAPKSDSQLKKTSPPNAKEPMQQLMIAIGKVWIPILLNPKMEDIQRFLPEDVVKNVYFDDQQRVSKWRDTIKKVQDAKNHVLKLRAEELEQTIKRSNSWPSPPGSEKRQVEALKTAYTLDRLRILLGGLTSVIDVDQTFDFRISDHERLRQWLARFCGVVVHNRFELESLRTQDKQAVTTAFWQARAPSGEWTPIAKRTLEKLKRHGGKAPDILELAIQFEFGLPTKEKAASKRDQTVFDRSRYDERISEGSSFDLILTRASDALYS